MKIKTKNGELTADSETVRLVVENPWNGKQGVIFDANGVCLGVKTLANPRQRKDGVTTGQVYCGKPNVAARVETGILESGESVSFIAASGESGKAAVEETFVFPATKRNTAGKYMEAGYMMGLSPAAMAWQFGLKDPKFADIVRKLLTVIHPAVADGYMHRISWPDGPSEVPAFIPPPHRIFRLDCPWGWIPVSERYGLSVVHDSASKWQRVLGWKGNDGAAAAYQCQKSMHNKIGVYAVRWWGGMFVSADMTPENPEWEV